MEAGLGSHDRGVEAEGGGLTGSPRHPSGQLSQSSPLPKVRQPARWDRHRVEVLDRDGNLITIPGKHTSPLASGAFGAPRYYTSGSAEPAGIADGTMQADGISYVPFPSMRHAHHLSSQFGNFGHLGTLHSVGPRSPRRAPDSRDESALHRMSNSSIRPCIHDAALSHRFGAKAASRVLHNTGAFEPIGPPTTPVPVPPVRQDVLLGCGIVGGKTKLEPREVVVPARYAYVAPGSGRPKPPATRPRAALVYEEVNGNTEAQEQEQE